MDIRIPHSWLTEYLKTPLKGRELASRISLSGPSIDRIHQEKDEILYDAEITTNRPDSFSLYGFAREVAAIIDVPFKERFTQKNLDAWMRANTKKAEKYQKDATLKKWNISVRIQEPTMCHRYCTLVLDGLVLGPSPEWMQKRLVSLGLRPINNVVDITNYVMLEYGQPLHAFDADLLAGTNYQKTIFIRSALEGELFETLDGEKKKLKKGTCVIADANKILALAGIKGGKCAGISATTTTVVLEAAHFEPVRIRKTSRELQLRTDASIRFEKGLSSEYPPYALARMVDLLEKYAQGIVRTSLLDTYPVKEKEKVSTLSPTAYKRIVGVPLAPSQATASLQKLGFKKKSTSAKGVSFYVPFWRREDIEGEADLVEEVARMQGYTHLPIEGIRGSVPRHHFDSALFWESRTKHLLRDLGWTECMTYSLISEKSILQAGMDSKKCIRIINPLSRDFEYLRPSLFPALFEVIQENEQQSDHLRLFELGTVYEPSSKKNDLARESRTLVFAMNKKKAKGEELYLFLKGLAERLADEWFSSNQSDLCVKNVFKHPFFDSRLSAELFYRDRSIGVIGVPRAEVIKKYGFKTPIGLGEIRFDACIPFMTLRKNFISLPKFPSSVRDIACVLEKKYTYESLFQTLKSLDSLIVSVELFDVFEHDTLGKLRKSFAFHITYQSNERTLLAQEVDIIHERVRMTLKEKFHVEIRS